jgi:hypothetical protein
VQAAGDADADSTHITLRPVGQPNGVPATEVVRLEVEDRLFGLSHAQLTRIGSVLGDGALARCVELRFSFEGEAV